MPLSSDAILMYQSVSIEELTTFFRRIKLQHRSEFVGAVEFLAKK